MQPFDICKYKWRKDTYERIEGNFLYAMSRIEKLNDFLKSNPADSFVQHALALEYVKIGDDEKARELFEAILQREPGYVGSYYHLAKLLERIGEIDEAVMVYKKGMTEAEKAGDTHAYGELKSAYEELTF
ncbi:MAG: tetratricopeptide repeat protein [Bacteroidota bacterium]|nr:tetratricopeptide repeat protein [Bacteroidota bacterium]